MTSEATPCSMVQDTSNVLHFCTVTIVTGFNEVIIMKVTVIVFVYLLLRYCAVTDCQYCTCCKVTVGVKCNSI